MKVGRVQDWLTLGLVISIGMKDILKVIASYQVLLSLRKISVPNIKSEKETITN